MKSIVGQVLETQRDIEQESVNFYTKILNETEEDRARDTGAITRNIPKLVTPKHNAMLMSLIEREEVEEVVFQMEKGQAPGPDCFTIDFFQKCWDLVKEEIWAVVEESRRMGWVLKAFNSTFLTLIPKEQGAESPGMFRPISLCNVILKIIMKVLANRLKPLMPGLISPEKIGFMEGRQILD